MCADEYKRMRTVRRKREHDELYNLRSRGAEEEPKTEEAEGGFNNNNVRPLTFVI